MDNSKIIKTHEKSDNTQQHQRDRSPHRIEFGTRLVVHTDVAKKLFDDAMNGAPYAEDIRDAIEKFRYMDSIEKIPIQGDKQKMVDVLSRLATVMEAADKDAADKKKPAHKGEFDTVYEEVIKFAVNNERVRYVLKELRIPTIEEMRTNMIRGTDITRDKCRNISLNANRYINDNRDVDYWSKIKYAVDILDAVRTYNDIKLDAFLPEAAILVKHANKNEGKAHMTELKRGILNAIEPITEKRLLRFLSENLPERTARIQAPRDDQEP